MVVHVRNPHEGRKTEDVAREMVGRRTFVGWPFLQEGTVVAVSDSLFKYEVMRVAPGAPERVVSTPHAPQALSHWKGKAERIESFYSKKCGVITGDVDVLVHVRPLKGLKRLESGAFVKDYEGPEKEMEQAAQMVLSEVACEDPRFMEKEAPALADEFPEGSNIFFLGEHAYGTAARVSKTEETTLSIVLAFIPASKDESERFREVVRNRVSHEYFLAHKAASMLGMSGRALSRITSSFMVLEPGAGGGKANIGLSLKFEAKALKVINWSRKEGRQWEFSDRAVDLIREYKAKFPEVFRCLDQNGDAMTRVEDIWPENSHAQLKEVKVWLKEKGVKDFEPVSLFSDQLDKATVGQLEELANDVAKTAQSTAYKKAIVKGIPRHAVLKPQHAVYRLQNQRFVLGDRVTMVQDSGSVPMAVKGVVIGLNSKSMDVLWDVAFMAGTTLGDRCSSYRGSTVEFASCLNLTQPQFIASTAPGSKPPPRPTQAFQPRAGPYPAVRPPQGQQAVAGFRSAQPERGGRGRGGFPPRGGPPHQHPHAHVPHRGGYVPRGGHGPRGGRGGPRGGFRGRGGIVQTPAS
ncbi:hypothetical protein CONPUDRAFT_50671 [Coniophora puteana RWD-64-598 SS2]|uniref:Uncharacterized protein n=1 Tax=Coniophora puteana (strain RWD-64-598) TaxID=741705 RepID=A0A5M3MZ73_CONPW|nr:uncharacterized protein CONPUDRAFT_50671 [Coniophora puteana RWD-64-598 SS2]EIW84429.1 hypothetical protein CONPUDRAFT_50671 [Coniophora puteana RWD-64-598 SS2]